MLVFELVTEGVNVFVGVNDNVVVGVKVDVLVGVGVKSSIHP